MANYANLKSDIAGVIRTNHNEEITGDILQEQLFNMVDELGAGYHYMGVAVPATNPGTPDANVFYIASNAGTYTNFGGAVVADGEVAILKYNGSWTKEVTGAATAAQVTQLGQDLEESANNFCEFDFPYQGNFDVNGNINYSNSLFHSTDYIRAKGKIYHALKQNNGGSQQRSIACYDSDKVFISILATSSDGSTIDEVDIPSNAAYIRACCLKTSTPYLVVGGVGLNAVENSVKTDVLSEESELVSKSLNLNPLYCKIVQGSIDSGVIVETPTTNVASVTFLPITAEPAIVAKTLSNSTLTVGRRYYDENKAYLGASYSSSAKYVRFIVLSASVSNLKVTLNGNQLDFENKYIKSLTADDVSQQIADEAVTAATLFDYKSKNMYNPAWATYDRRWALGWREIRAFASGTTCGSGFIPVEEGKTYTVSGTGIYDWTAGYFAKNAVDEVGQDDVDTVNFVTPVDGVGKYFTVPTGQNIGYVSLILKCNAGRTALDGTVMINEGEIAADYEPYNPQPFVKESLLPAESGSSDIETMQKMLASLPSFLNYFDTGKIDNFRQHYLAKDKDLVVLNTGTSLTMSGARNGACRLQEDIAYRPPLATSLNYFSDLFDKLVWSNQYYRRYDAMTEKGGETPMFTETGTFISTMGISAWDDYGYRDGFTRYADATDGVSLAFSIPKAANQFNFIYRTDLIGCQNCAIAITEGNGYVEVWNGSAWVEANGYTFSMRETAVTKLSSVSYINPSNGNPASLSNYQVKGNSTYQKRLKMRTVLSHRDVPKGVTISATESGARFMYWGVEWSLRPYMITLINAARGSHNPLIAINSEMRELNHYQDNEVWEFKPDIFITENPLINAGSSGPERYTTMYWNNVTNNFFFAENGVSMKDRAKTLFGSTYADSIEWVIFNTSPALSHSFSADNEEMCEENLSGDYLTWLDANEMTHQWLNENHPEVVSINSARYWREAALRLFGSVYQSCFAGNSPTLSNTFSYDGTHWNEMGCKIMAKAILPVLDFIL